MHKNQGSELSVCKDCEKDIVVFVSLNIRAKGTGRNRAQREARAERSLGRAASRSSGRATWSSNIQALLPSVDCRWPYLLHYYLCAPRDIPSVSSLSEE